MNIVGPVLGHYDALKTLFRKGFKGDYLFTGHLFSLDPQKEREDELILHWLFQFKKSKKITVLLGFQEMILVDQYLSLNPNYQPLLSKFHKKNFIFNEQGKIKDPRREEQIAWLATQPLYVEYKKVLVSPEENMSLTAPRFFKDLTPEDLKNIRSKNPSPAKRRIIGTLPFGHNRGDVLKNQDFFSLDSFNPSSGEILVLQYPTYVLSSYNE